ncbi:Hypothetical predicted protein, partial [Marmota monax]
GGAVPSEPSFSPLRQQQSLQPCPAHRRCSPRIWLHLQPHCVPYFPNDCALSLSFIQAPVLWSGDLGTDSLIFPDPFGGHAPGNWRLRPWVSPLVVRGFGDRESPLLPSTPTDTSTPLALGELGVGSLLCFPRPPQSRPRSFTESPPWSQLATGMTVTVSMGSQQDGREDDHGGSLSSL